MATHDVMMQKDFQVIYRRKKMISVHITILQPNGFDCNRYGFFFIPNELINICSSNKNDEDQL